MANPGNAHAVGLFTNTKVDPGPHGILLGENQNISPCRYASGGNRKSRKNRRRRKKNKRNRRSRRRRRRRNRRSNKKNRRRGSRKKNRKRKKRQQRGGGYGFNPNGFPHKGLINFDKISNCGIIPRSGNLGIGKQDALLSQKGGGKGLTYGEGGYPYYEYSSNTSPDLTRDLRGGYAPITRKIRPQCGGKRKSRRNRRKNNKNSRKNRKNTHIPGHNPSRRRRNQRGGYHQYLSNVPDTPGQRTPNGGGYKTANPTTFSVLNNCVDNYNHYTGKGSPSPVLDQDVQTS